MDEGAVRGPRTPNKNDRYSKKPILLLTAMPAVIYC